MKQEEDNVKKKEILNLSKIDSVLLGNYATGPDTLELVMEKKKFKKLLTEFKEYSKIINKPFSISIIVDLYDIPEESNFRPDFSILKVYPRGQKNISDWVVAQHIVSKCDATDVVESPIIQISDLIKHYNTYEN